MSGCTPTSAERAAQPVRVRADWQSAHAVSRSLASAPRPSSTATVAWIIAAVVVAVCAVMLVGESRYRSCIARAEAEFPAVPVSSFNGEVTGPLKVSFVSERARALEDCGRFF